jgi:anti-sigma regulatory factor (Ser/Thr protein kinase)
VVHVPELDRTARAGRLSQVDGVARELVARVGGPEAGSARVVIDLRVPEGLVQLLAAAAAARQDRDRVSVEVVTLRRGLARRLAAEGFAVRDVAALLGLSIGRAQQLIGEAFRPQPQPVLADRELATVAGASGLADQASQAPIAEVSPSPVRPHRAYQHEALLYRGEEDFLAATVPFVLEGVALGQPVMVAVTAARLGQLRAAVGADASGVHFVDMAELGANPARIIPAWRAFVDEYGGRQRPVRGIGEPVWAGRRATEVVECHLHEALLNVAVEPDVPLWLLCPYDADALPEPVIAEAARSHPSLREGEAYRGSTSYGGSQHVQTLFGGVLPAPPPEATATRFAREDLGQLRRLVQEHAAAAGLRRDRTADLVAAVTEVATNSIRHGSGGGTLRLWRQEDALVCEVTDPGHITDPLVGRRTPSQATEGGRGLWLANQLCDLIQVRSTPAGTTIRLHSWL